MLSDRLLQPAGSLAAAPAGSLVSTSTVGGGAGGIAGGPVAGRFGGESQPGTVTRSHTHTRNNSVSVVLAREPDSPPRSGGVESGFGEPVGGSKQGKGAGAHHSRVSSSAYSAALSVGGAHDRGSVSVSDVNPRRPSLNDPNPNANANASASVAVAPISSAAGRSRPTASPVGTGTDDSDDTDDPPSYQALASSSFDLTAAPKAPSKSAHKWVWQFSDRFERAFQRFDDAIIGCVQSPLRRTPRCQNAIKFAALFVTLLTSIELGVSLPFALHFVGSDYRGAQASVLVLVTCVFSQIPKRFVWRPRPWMSRRALTLRTDATSSFPSRAVTCAVVYGYLIGSAVSDRAGVVVIGVGIVGAALLSSLSRIVLGAHYPSDCLVGVLMGTTICGVAHALFTAEIGYCESCATGACYAAQLSRSIESFGDVNGRTLGLCVALALVVCVLSMSPPVHFWRKGQFVYGMLLSCLTFRLCFLCPANGGMSLAPPTDFDAGAYVLAIVVAAAASAAGLLLAKLKGALSLAMFSLLFMCVLVILAFWRLLHRMPITAP